MTRYKRMMGFEIELKGLEHGEQWEQPGGGCEGGGGAARGERLDEKEA